MSARIHILGASGAGVTTLGRAVAAALAVPHLDTDDFFWLPSDPPFQTARPRDARVPLILRNLPPTGGWVLSGSALGWGDPLAPLYDLIVYVTLDPDIRLRRLAARERQRYGARIDAGGDMANTHTAFLKWAASYETGGVDQRSRAAHAQWLETQRARVLRLDSAAPLDSLTQQVVAAA